MCPAFSQLKLGTVDRSFSDGYMLSYIAIFDRQSAFFVTSLSAVVTPEHPFFLAALVCHRLERGSVRRKMCKLLVFGVSEC